VTREQAEEWARRKLIALLRRGFTADETGALVLGDLVVIPDGTFDWHDQAWPLAASDKLAWETLGRCYARWLHVFEAAREADSGQGRGNMPGACPLCAGGRAADRRL